MAVSDQQEPTASTDTEGMSYMFHYCTTTYDYAKTVVDFFATQMKPMVAAKPKLQPCNTITAMTLLDNAVEQATKYWIQNESLPINIVADRKHPTSSSDLPN